MIVQGQIPRIPEQEPCKQAQPLVSIIITSYNYGRFLARAIESALGQTYPNVEVIAIDDGSTDNSREIIASYDNRILPVLKDNGGQASAFNRGFQVSTGDIIIFLDSDDALSPSVADEVVKAWETGLSKIHYRLQWIDAHGKPLNDYSPPAAHALSSGDLKAVLLTQGAYRTPPTSGNAFSRNFLTAVLPIPEKEWRLCPDAYLHYLAPFYGRIGAIDKPLGDYRVHGLNASTVTKKKPYIERLSDEILFRDKCEALIRKEADRLKITATSEPTVFLARKLALFLAHPDHHLVRHENIVGLVQRGISSIWRESEITPWRKIIISIYFLFVPILPRRLAAYLTFLYIYPDQRPRLLRQLIS